ncbi:carbohydrate porin [Methylopila turkensis]|uniref:Porin n=1 Tax=Methylopila turkensis TaxID=1437816 RepID=A0A9W6JM26_9HYPH|nr:carbohydrate porin [Methylopila turkensis]GLK78320.1 porin [Methylopila turkensis]
MRRFRSAAAGAAGLVLFGLCPAAPALADDDDGGSVLDSVPTLSELKAGRDALAERGFRFSGFYFSDMRAVARGGISRGGAYMGLASLSLDVDAEKTLGIEGGSLHVNALQIHGRDLAERRVGNILAGNDIGAMPTTRLFELYYEQRFDDRLAVRVGQLAADEVFLKSGYAELFIGATFGWAASPSENLPQEGPAYPLAALGAQATFEATDDLTVRAAIYNGAAAPLDAEEPEEANRRGSNFRLKDPPLVIAEGEYRYGGGEEGLSGAVKLGGYLHFGDFARLRDGEDAERTRDRNFNVYAVWDQQVFRPEGEDDEAGFGVFARVILGPSDRNAVSAYVDGGVVVRGMVPSRPADVFGVAVAYADFSPALAHADRAANVEAGVRGPVRDFEMTFEANYRAEIVPGLTVQPTAQYVVHPGGSVAHPKGDGRRRIPDALVFGLTTIARF